MNAPLQKRYLPHVLAALVVFLAVMPVAGQAANPVKPGAYCPSPSILRIVAEDLSTSLELVMQSRAAQTQGDPIAMQALLNAAGTTLKQATSRGAGARTALLINSTILFRVNESNDQLLTWFPMLHSALLTLPEDAASNATDDAIGRAEEILRVGGDGDPLALLKKASHFLTCDDLNLPLQAALKEQQHLLAKIRQQKPVVTKDYDKMLDNLRMAISYVLEHSQT